MIPYRQINVVTGIGLSIVKKLSLFIKRFRNTPDLKINPKDELNHLHIRKYVTRRYLIAILLVFLVTIIGNLLLFRSIFIQNDNAEIINIAGKQRMLLQRTAALTEIIYFENDKTKTLQTEKLLVQSLDQMKAQHLQLSAFLRKMRESGQENLLLEALYFSQPNSLNIKILQYIDLNYQFLADGAIDDQLMKRIGLLSIDPLISNLDTAVNLYQANAEQELAYTTSILKVNTVIIILLLLGQIIFIFRPLTNQLSRQAEDLNKKASTDSLTGLLNRQAFATHFSKIIDEAHLQGNSVSLIALNLDWFKEINQAYGLMAGDAVIGAIGKRLHPLISDTTNVTRLGGDEFALIFAHNNGPQWALDKAEEIRKMVVEPIDYKGKPLQITATVGTASFPEDAMNIGDLLQAAIHALKLAKEQDRGTIQAFLPSLRNGIERDRIVLQSLERKEGLDGLFIEFQPLINLKTLQITGCEALVRWQHPALGLVRPDQFLKLAISHGHGAYIGVIIRSLAMKGFNELRLAGIFIKSLSMNLMNVELKSLSHAQELVEQIKVFGLTPQDIEIEVTEDVALNRFGGDLNSKLADMREAGFRLALDDFGTGFASLEHLIKLEVDVIKLDRTFVAQITKDRRSKKIIAAIINLAHSLSLKVIAEGIETTEQLDILKALSCDIGQGYLLGRPMTVNKLVDWHEEHKLSLIKE